MSEDNTAPTGSGEGERILPPPLQFAPPAHRNEALVDRAPALTRDAIMNVYETAAQQSEAAAEALMQMTLERCAELKESAQTLRELGALQAASVERAANFAKISADLFKSHAANVTAFRAETTPGAVAA